MPVMMIDTVDSYVDYIDEETWQQLVASLLYAHRAGIISQRCVKRACVKQPLYSFATSAVCRAA
jgi:hypothetical protein